MTDVWLLRDGSRVVGKSEVLRPANGTIAEDALRK